MVVYPQPILTSNTIRLTGSSALQADIKEMLLTGRDIPRRVGMRKGKHSMAFSQNKVGFFSELSHQHHLYLNITFNQLFNVLTGVSSISSGAKKFVRGFSFTHCG